MTEEEDIELARHKIIENMNANEEWRKRSD